MPGALSKEAFSIVHAVTPRLTLRMHWCFTVVIVASVASSVAAQDACMSATDCNDCRNKPDNCMWCANPNFNQIGQGRSHRRRFNTRSRYNTELSRCTAVEGRMADSWKDICGPEHIYADPHDSCSCAESDHPSYVAVADECSGEGASECGICKCAEGFFGTRCECWQDPSWGRIEVDDTSVCRAPGSRRGNICSGRGTCECGECLCDERSNPSEFVNGMYCQCTNFLCDRIDGQLCGGPERGECLCNECQCRPGYYGDACEYDSSNDQCINPDNSRMCSGNGICENNACKCFESMGCIGGQYSGKWCEDCPSFRGECMIFKPCVQCVVFGTGEWSSQTCEDQCRVLRQRTSVVSQLEVLDGEYLCSFFDENDCRFTFAYGYNQKEEPVIRVKKAMDCPPIPGILDGVDQLSDVSNLLGAFYGFAKDVVDNTLVKFFKDMATHIRR